MSPAAPWLPLGRLIAVCLLIYSAMFHGGIRSPDGEVVYRVAEALATSGTFAVVEELPLKGFGLPHGLDGRLYSVFGPGMSVALVPLYLVAEAINATAWYTGNSDIMRNRYFGDLPLAGHANRFVVSLFNAFMTTWLVGVFFLWLLKLHLPIRIAEAGGYLLGFATLFFPYSSYFFSETLCAIFCVLAFMNVDLFSATSYPKLLSAGFFLGIAITVHITAILFVPFLIALACPWPWSNARDLLKRATCFVVGLMPWILLLGWYNWVRFGSPLETGRGVERVYAVWVEPWLGLYGLVLSPSKGLAWQCPICVLGAILWWKFYRLNRYAASVCAAMIIFRIVFIASRSDWSGGFCIGPRYLLLIIPFFILPIVFWLRDHWETISAKLRWGVFAFVYLCVVQQIYFTLGDIFAYLFMVRKYAIDHGVALLHAWYLDWQTTSLFYLLQSARGPFLLQGLQVNNYIVWGWLSSIALLLILSLSHEFMFLPSQRAVERHH